MSEAFLNFLETLKCQCGCGFKPMNAYLILVKKLYDIMGGDLIGNSGARCPAHNAKVGGAKNSLHMRAIAGDFHCRDLAYQERLHDAAVSVGFRGFGFASKFLHIDLGPPREWRYDANGKVIVKG